MHSIINSDSVAISGNVQGKVVLTKGFVILHPHVSAFRRRVGIVVRNDFLRDCQFGGSREVGGDGVPVRVMMVVIAVTSIYRQQSSFFSISAQHHFYLLFKQHCRLPSPFPPAATPQPNPRSPAPSSYAPALPARKFSLVT
jgi:hypothetical protein